MAASTSTPPEVPAGAERADAARNHRRALAAAERLFAERGVAETSMDDIARAAGVGKGTLYRRFGDRAGLALALLDQRERKLQEAVLRGAPPLGPGAPAGERLVAFVGALADLLEAATDLIVESENAAVGARYRNGAYAGFRMHARMLIAAARPDLDADVTADLVLAPLAGDLYRHLRRERGLSPERIREALVALARGMAERPR
jgi:AcrR family transcriptional regulator